MSFKTIEEFNAAIEAPWEEYEEYMLRTKQWRTAEEKEKVDAAVNALIEGVLDYCKRK